MSLAILNSDTATVLMAPCVMTSASCAARASNLLGADVKGSPVSSAISFAIRSANPLGALRPVPTAVPPWASCISSGSVLSMRAMPFSICLA